MIVARGPATSLGSLGHALPVFNKLSTAEDAGKVRLVGGGLSQQVLEDHEGEDKPHVGDYFTVLAQSAILHFQHGPKAGQLNEMKR